MYIVGVGEKVQVKVGQNLNFGSRVQHLRLHGSTTKNTNPVKTMWFTSQDTNSLLLLIIR